MIGWTVAVFLYVIGGLTFAIHNEISWRDSMKIRNAFGTALWPGIMTVAFVMAVAIKLGRMADRRQKSG